MVSLLIPHAPASLGLCEAPLDHLAAFIRRLVPGRGFSLQSLDVANTTIPQALSRVHANGDLGLIEPTGMHRRVVYLKSIPYSVRKFFAQVLYNHLAIRLSEGNYIEACGAEEKTADHHSIIVFAA